MRHTLVKTWQQRWLGPTMFTRSVVHTRFGLCKAKAPGHECTCAMYTSLYQSKLWHDNESKHYKDMQLCESQKSSLQRSSQSFHTQPPDRAIPNKLFWVVAISQYSHRKKNMCCTMTYRTGRKGSMLECNVYNYSLIY